MALNLFQCHKNTQHTIEHITYQYCLAGIFKNLLVTSGILSVLILFACVVHIFVIPSDDSDIIRKKCSADVVNFQ
jgi:hypothetical protein